LQRKDSHIYLLGEFLRVRDDFIGNEGVLPVVIEVCKDLFVNNGFPLKGTHEPIAFLAPHASSSPNITASFWMTLCGLVRVDGTSDLTMDARGMG
jgi:hypothetical protein